MCETCNIWIRRPIFSDEIPRPVHGLPSHGNLIIQILKRISYLFVFKNDFFKCGLLHDTTVICD
jgi:hypothetical protein